MAVKLNQVMLNQVKLNQVQLNQVKLNQVKLHQTRDNSRCIIFATRTLTLTTGPTAASRRNPGVNFVIKLQGLELERDIIIVCCNKTMVAFSFVVVFDRGRSLVVALSLPIARWPLKKSDCSLVAPRVNCDVNGKNHIKNGFL